MVYSGLTKVIGAPKDLEKNLAEPTYFDSVMNLGIPVETTKEFIAHENAKKASKKSQNNNNFINEPETEVT